MKKMLNAMFFGAACTLMVCFALGALVLFLDLVSAGHAGYAAGLLVLVFFAVLTTCAWATTS